MKRFKNKKCRLVFVGMLVCSFLGFGANPGFAADDVRVFHKNYPVRQEKLKEGGVLVARPNLFDERMFEVISVHKFKTLEAYADWLEATITYVEDGVFDKWADPEETLKNKRGDCEDYAILNLTVLRKMGFETRFVGLFRKGKAHAICVVKQDGYYAWFDNAQLKRTKAKSLAELAKQITQEYAYYKVSEFNLDKQDWDTIYEVGADRKKKS